MKQSGKLHPTGFKSKSGFNGNGGIKKVGFKRKPRHIKHKPLGNGTKKPKKNSPLQIQIKKTDEVYSTLVRLSAANSSGIVKCYTCDYRGPWKYGKIQCGHYMSRANKGTRWMINANKPQCSHCNEELKGNREIFRKNLIKEHGLKFVEMIEARAAEVINLREDDVRAIRLELNKLLREVKIKKSIR